MRPGQSCPGVGDIEREVLPVVEIGFNEAGAIMPRSGHSTTSPSLSVSGLQ